MIAASPDGGAVVASVVKATVAVPDETGSGAIPKVAYAVWVLKVDAAGVPQWSAFLGAGELIENGPRSVRIAALPNRGAVVTYLDVDVGAGEGTVHVVRFDAGAQSATRRWDHTYTVDDSSGLSGVLAVDDDVDGTIDGVLITAYENRDQIQDSTWWPQGTVRKLDIDDGSQIWRKNLGRWAAGIASTCVPGGTFPCQYVVAAQDDDEAIV